MHKLVAAYARAPKPLADDITFVIVKCSPSVMPGEVGMERNVEWTNAIGTPRNAALAV